MTTTVHHEAAALLSIGVLARARKPRSNDGMELFDAQDFRHMVQVVRRGRNNSPRGWLLACRKSLREMRDRGADPVSLENARFMLRAVKSAVRLSA